MPSLYCTRAKYYPGLDVTVHLEVDPVISIIESFFLLFFFKQKIMFNQNMTFVCI